MTIVVLVHDINTRNPLKRRMIEVSNMGDENKDLIRRWFEEVWNQGQYKVVDEMLAPNAPSYGLGGGGEPVRGPEALKAFQQGYPRRVPGHPCRGRGHSRRGGQGRRTLLRSCYAHGGFPRDPTDRTDRHHPGDVHRPGAGRPDSRVVESLRFVRPSEADRREAMNGLGACPRIRVRHPQVFVTKITCEF